MGISKSVYMEGITCPRRAWLSRHQKKEERVSLQAESLMNSGNEIGNAAKSMFGDYVEVEYSDQKQDMINQTLILMAKKEKVIAEASFAADGCYCQADILRNNADGSVSVYEVKGTTKIKPYHLDDMAFQYHVITSAGFKIRNFYHIHINSDYIREEELDLDKLFIITDCTDMVTDLLDGIKDRIADVARTLEEVSEPHACIGLKCKDPTECPFFGHCSKNLPENNVFDIAGMGYKKKFELFDRGFVEFQDLLKPNMGIKLNQKQKQQVEATLYKQEPSYDLERIRGFMGKLTMPLYFLDFETFQQAVPGFSETKPFSQIVFQYSLHYIEKPGGELKHTEYLGTPPEDPRYEAARRLCEDIPRDVTTLAYNMAFERMILQGLAELFPEFYDHLMNIRSNMKDLMDPFKNRWYYDRNFKGSYSIKTVLPVLFPDDPSLDYHNLDEEVQNGSMAMAAYAAMETMTDKKKIQKIRQCLLEYCCLDTFAMVKIWQFLADLCK